MNNVSMLTKITLVYDRDLSILTAGDRQSKNWKSTRLKWSALAARLELPVRTSETMADYEAMSKADQGKLKDVGGFVGGAFKGSRRKADELVSRDLITLDLDSIPSGETDTVLKKIASGRCASFTYPTRSSRPEKPRFRVVIPSDRPMTPDEYEPAARKIAEVLGLLSYCDPTTFQGSRLMYFPSISKDQTFNTQLIDSPFVDISGVLASFDWKNYDSWPIVDGESHRYRTAISKQEDPTLKDGIVGAFCRTYSISEAIDSFLKGIYIEAGEDRYTFTKGSTAGGAVVYDEKFLYSHHATDPCSSILVNSFDLVRLHLFRAEDTDIELDCPAHKTPSFLKMSELAQHDSRVQAEYGKERAERLREAFGDEIDLEIEDIQEAIDNDDGEWRQKLTFKKGTDTVYTNLQNVVLILENEPRLKDRIGFDEFIDRLTIKKRLPWGDPTPGRAWRDNDDANLALLLETLYGVSSSASKIIQNAIEIVSKRQAFNSVEEYLKGLTWDGIPRIKTLLHDYLGAEANEYTAQVMTVTLVNAVKRAIIGGTKWDYVPILKGPQGIGKSKFLAALGGRWFSDSIQTFDGREAIELIQGKWINELPELSAFGKSETNRIKQFVTKQADHYRASYARNAETRPRRCIFIGTTNDDEFLKDPTGSRRFWPVRLAVVNPELDIDSLVDDPEGKTVDQIWAEAYSLYLKGSVKPWLTDEAAKIALTEQKSHEVGDDWEGLIKDYLDRLIPSDWINWNLDQRRIYLNGGSSDIPADHRIDKICIMEIWCEALNGLPQYLDRSTRCRISAVMKRLPGWRSDATIRTSYCGIQKGYVRIAKM